MVLRHFFDRYNRAPSSYGVNFQATVAQTSPRVWIRDNLVSESIEKKTGRNLIGGTGIGLRLEGPWNKIWNITVNPDDTGKIKLDFNASQEKAPLPDEATLRSELSEQYMGFVSLIKLLGL